MSVSGGTPAPGPPEPVRFRGTLASRVALLAALAVTASVVFGSAAAYAVVRHQLYAALDRSLLERAEAAAESPALGELTRENVPSWALGAADIKIAVLSADGTITDAEEGTTSNGGTIKLGDEEIAVARGESPSSTRTVRSGGGERYRLAAVPGNSPDSALILAQSLDPTYDALGKLGVVLVLFGLLGIGLAGLIGWMVARSGLSPVRGLTEDVEEIARTEDLRPIKVRGHDEVARLAVAFNQVLAALDRSRTRQSQLVADAGHELRTPLTSLRTNLDLLRQADDPARPGSLEDRDRAELMDDLRFQIDELTHLIGDLTELARQDEPEVRWDRVDLAEVVEHAVDRVRRRGGTLHFDVHAEPWWVSGDPQAIERAVTNLLDNAAKWSPPLGRVTVTLHEGVLAVLDQGPGIPAADLPHIFERFYRSAESRTMPGSGLGLAIVAKVAQLHGGWVRAGAAPDGGAAFWLALPGNGTRPDDPLDTEGRSLRPPQHEEGRRLTPPSHGTLSPHSATRRTLEP
jgi:two-component system, OmpR family, sensor histidine kinase MprB